MTVAAGVDLRPTENELAEAVEMAEKFFPFEPPTHGDLVRLLHHLLSEDPRNVRIAEKLTKLALMVEALEDEVRTWLCPGCNTAYPEPPGPKDNWMTRFECPNCHDVVGLKNNILLRREREERKAEKLAFENQLQAFAQVARDTSDGTRDLVGALDDIANIDTAPDSPNAAGWRAVVVWCALRAKQGLEAFSHPLRPVLPVPEPPVPAPVTPVPPSHA